jgi:cell division protein FtsB
MPETPISDAAGAPKSGGVTRGRLVLRYALLALTALVLVDSIVGEKGLLALVRARHELRTLEHAVQAARVENQRMLEQARKYREDPATIEELARRDLGLIKPGEKLFIIRDLPPAPPR